MKEIYLFEKDGKNVEIFQLHPKIEQLREFRATILEHKKLFYLFEGNTNYSGNFGLNLKNGVYRFSKQRLAYMAPSSTFGTYNSILGYTSVEMKRSQRMKLELYISGYYENLKYEYLPKRYNYSDDKKDNERQFYFLLFGGKIDYPCRVTSQFDHAIKISNLLSLPKDHFQLHMLLNGYFDELRDEKMKLDPTMFDINFYKRIKISQLENLNKMGLINESMQDIDAKIDTTSKILRQLRK